MLLKLASLDADAVPDQKADAIDRALKAGCSKAVCELILNLLQAEPSSRPTALAVIGQLAPIGTASCCVVPLLTSMLQVVTQSRSTS
jgi:hypothetical protein